MQDFFWVGRFVQKRSLDGAVGKFAGKVGCSPDLAGSVFSGGWASPPEVPVSFAGPGGLSTPPQNLLRFHFMAQ